MPVVCASEVYFTGVQQYEAETDTSKICCRVVSTCVVRTEDRAAFSFADEIYCLSLGWNYTLSKFVHMSLQLQFVSVLPLLPLLF